MILGEFMCHALKIFLLEWRSLSEVFLHPFAVLLLVGVEEFFEEQRVVFRVA